MRGKMVALVQTVAYLGLEARGVEVQCQVAPGLPAFNVVGLHPPIEIAKLGDNDEVDASYYQLGKSVFLVDYFVGSDRIGTAVYSRDNDLRIPRNIQLSKITLGDAVTICDGIFGSSHLFTYTGPCRGSSADSNFYHSYIFYTLDDEIKTDGDGLCNPLEFATTAFSPKRCPQAAQKTAVGGV